VNRYHATWHIPESLSWKGVILAVVDVRKKMTTMGMTARIGTTGRRTRVAGRNSDNEKIYNKSER
jgi:hypothetical protein